MTWARATSAPSGWQASVLRAGDTLASLERESGVKAEIIAQANGVPWPGRKTCTWARDISAWVLATGGHRNDVVASDPNTCEPGQGFANFTTGQVVFLPRGLRAPPATAQPPASTAPKKSNTALWIGGGIAAALAAAAAAAAAKKKKGKAA